MPVSGKRRRKEGHQRAVCDTALAAGISESGGGEHRGSSGDRRAGQNGQEKRGAQIREDIIRVRHLFFWSGIYHHGVS